ncbi:MATE family efflux transporter [Noviherbaspirillum malthae]|jgi:MATE family multidrug resistance protein|uniref:MATE family efflux transporter n=1 Tax=Noviherbaspirillum malthae TaxID=1260987 RepID=UPI00188FCB98|nr:MATE family efflux transporter [Noviherbaspirillum malthae]
MSSITPLQALKPSQSEWRSELKSTLSLGWPLILTNLAQTILTATDLALIGRLGADSLAAAALAASFYHAVMIFCLGVVSAVMPLIASTLGARPHAVREVRITIRHGFWIAGLISIPVWLLLWNADSVLILLGQQPEVARRSLEFMHALQWALLPFLGYIVLRSYLNAMQSPIWTLAVGCAAIAFNALAAWCLIFGNLGFPALGLTGAGLASFCSSLLMFGGLALVVSRHRRFRRYHLFGNLFDIDMRRLRQVWQLGLPVGATMAFETTIFYAAVVMMGLIGQTALAAHAIAMQIASIGFMVPLGFGQVATIRVGRAYGARDAAGIARAGWSAYALGVGFMVITASLMLFAPTLLIGLFIDIRDPQNADVVQLGAGFLALAALFQLADGAQVVGAGMLRGIHDTRVPMLLAALGYWGIGLPLGAALAFALDMGGAGVWLGLAAGLGTVAVLMTRRWMRRGQHYAIGIP